MRRGSSADRVRPRSARRTQRLAFGIDGRNRHRAPCRNPYDDERLPGRSSSGPAAANGGGLVAAALHRHERLDPRAGRAVRRRRVAADVGRLSRRARPRWHPHRRRRPACAVGRRSAAVAGSAARGWLPRARSAASRTDAPPIVRMRLVEQSLAPSVCGPAVAEPSTPRRCARRRRAARRSRRRRRARRSARRASRRAAAGGGRIGRCDRRAGAGARRRGPWPRSSARAIVARATHARAARTRADCRSDRARTVARRAPLAPGCAIQAPPREALEPGQRSGRVAHCATRCWRARPLTKAPPRAERPPGLVERLPVGAQLLAQRRLRRGAARSSACVWSC